MARTSNIYARVEPELKYQAESVLGQLGIPMSNAISLFLRQVVLQRGIPFEMKLPQKKPLEIGAVGENDLDKAIQDGFDDLEAGRIVAATSVVERMRRDFNI